MTTKLPTQRSFDFVGRDRVDVTFKESSLAIVLFVGEAASGIEIDVRDDGQPLQDEPARATE
jgi:hypothetical protein